MGLPVGKLRRAIRVALANTTFYKNLENSALSGPPVVATVRDKNGKPYPAPHTRVEQPSFLTSFDSSSTFYDSSVTINHFSTHHSWNEVDGMMDATQERLEQRIIVDGFAVAFQQQERGHGQIQDVAETNEEILQGVQEFYFKIVKTNNN